MSYFLNVLSSLKAKLMLSGEASRSFKQMRVWIVLVCIDVLPTYVYACFQRAVLFFLMSATAYDVRRQT